jgi:hypothetical protein
MSDRVSTVALIAGLLVGPARRLLKRRLRLPDWSADEAYLTKLRAWRRAR